MDPRLGGDPRPVKKRRRSLRAEVVGVVTVPPRAPRGPPGSTPRRDSPCGPACPVSRRTATSRSSRATVRSLRRTSPRAASSLVVGVDLVQGGRGPPRRRCPCAAAPGPGPAAPGPCRAGADCTQARAKAWSSTSPTSSNRSSSRSATASGTPLRASLVLSSDRLRAAPVSWSSRILRATASWSAGGPRASSSGGVAGAGPPAWTSGRKGPDGRRPERRPPRTDATAATRSSEVDARRLRQGDDLFLVDLRTDPSFSRILFSSSLARSGLSRRKVREFSLPWPSWSPS